MPFVSTPAPTVEGLRGMLTTPSAARERLTGLRLLAEPVVLAVSGGADSMVMAAVLFARCPEMIVALATFDHGTGAAASEAALLVEQWGRERGLSVRIGRAAATVQRNEAAWRMARWEYLRAVSDEFRAPVATAHTEDDQAETVFLRLLRGSGVRGLAALLAAGPVLRPMLGVSRAAVRQYAALAGVPFVDDPSNVDLGHQRNRVRLELLPTLERATPGFRAWLLQLGERAAEWRAAVELAADAYWAPELVDGAVVVARDPNRLPSEAEAALFWPVVAGRIGVPMDWRGTERLASFTTGTASGRRMPLSGGVVVRCERRKWKMERQT